MLAWVNLVKIIHSHKKTQIFQKIQRKLELSCDLTDRHTANLTLWVFPFFFIHIFHIFVPSQV